MWVHITASAFFDEHGAYVGGMAMVTDIRRRKAEERALELAREAAEALARLRQEQVEEAEAMSAVSSALPEPWSRAGSTPRSWNRLNGFCTATTPACCSMRTAGPQSRRAEAWSSQPDGTRVFPWRRSTR